MFAASISRALRRTIFSVVSGLFQACRALWEQIGVFASQEGVR